MCSVFEHLLKGSEKHGAHVRMALRREKGGTSRNTAIGSLETTKRKDSGAGQVTPELSRSNPYKDDGRRFQNSMRDN